MDDFAQTNEDAGSKPLNGCLFRPLTSRLFFNIETRGRIQSGWVVPAVQAPCISVLNKDAQFHLV